MAKKYSTDELVEIFGNSTGDPGRKSVVGGTSAKKLSDYGINLSDHAQKQIKEAYASTFANSYDYNVDQERMAKGLMPTAFDSKYQDTELDRLLYSMGLPSAADLPQAVDDYNEKTAPERQYQKVYNAIGKDVRPFLDENGELSENKVLDYLYKTVFVEDEFSGLKGKWDEYKEPSVDDGYDTYEASLRAGLKNDTSDYNIKKLMDDLNEGLQKANTWSGLAPVSSEKAREDAGVIHTVGQVAEPKTAEEDYFDKSEKVQQLYDEIRFLSQNGIDTTEKQAELDALIESTKQADPKRQQKEQWKAEDALLEEAVDLSLFRRENIPFSGPGEIVYSEELQAQVDAFRDQQIANGMTPLQVDNIIRRSGLNAYINNNVEIADYAASAIAEQNGITFDQAMAEYNAMPQSEKDMYAMDMQFDNRVHNSVTEEAGRAAAAIPARVALDIVNSAFNFADMMNPMAGIQNSIYDMAGIADPSEKARETLNAVSWKLGQFGSSENHEFINVASDVTTELIRMYAVNSAGVALAQGVNAPALVGKTPASEKGMGVLLNKVRKAFSTQTAPFIASAMGSYYNEALSEGANRGEATAYALIAGSFEGALEGLGADEIFQKTFTKGFIQRGKAGAEHLLSKGVSRFVDFTANMIGNGLEEGLSYVVSGIAARTIYDKDQELTWEEFWENAGMGALVGVAGSIATMGEGSRSYDLLQEAIDTKNASYFDQAYAAYIAETMPQGKYDVRLHDAMEMPIEEYRQVNADLYRNVQNASNAESQYEAQVASADERIAAAQEAVNDLVSRKDALSPDSKADIDAIGQLCKEIATAKRTYEKTLESANAAKETAKKEYEARRASLDAEKSVLQRRIEDHNIAYDLRMQQMMARQDVESAFGDLVEFMALDGYEAEKADAATRLDKALATEEWISMENKALSERWANDTEWQDTLRRVAEGRTAFTQTSSSSTPPDEDVTFDVDTTLPPDAEDVPPESKEFAGALGIVDPRVNETVTAARRMGRRAYQNFVSGQAPIERIGNRQTGVENGKASLIDLMQMARSAPGSVKTILYDSLTDRNGNDLGFGSWRDMVAKIPKGKEDAFIDYCLQLHNADRMSLRERGYGENKPMFASVVKDSAGNDVELLDPDGNVVPVSSEESDRLVMAYEAESPEFKTIADEMQRWWDTFMRKWAVDGGLVSEEDYDLMRAMYPHYVPTFREGDGIPSSAASRSGHTIGVSDPIKSAKGSFRPIQDFRNSFAKQINSLVRKERVNEMVLSLYGFAERNAAAAASEGVFIIDEKGNLVESDPDTKFDSLALETVEKTKDGDYVVRARRDGELVSMRVSEEIYEAIDLLVGNSFGDSTKARKLEKGVRFLNNLGNVFKGGITTYNPFFGITNAFRDLQTSFINTEANPVQYFVNIKDAVSEIAKNGEHWKNYKALGGKSSGYIVSGKGFVEDAFGDVSFGKKAFRKAGGILSAPGEFTESVFRFAEYLQGIKMHGDTPDGRRKAIQMAADVTTNFSRNAPYTKTLNAVTMYLNAQVQGIDKVARQIKKAPAKTLAKNIPFVAFAAFLLKGLGNEENPHYQNLTNHVKDNYFLIPNVFGQRDNDGNCTTFIKLPKSREYGIALVSLFERAARVPDEGFDVAFDGWWETLVSGFAPNSPITENMFSPLMQAQANKTYYGGDIVPQYMLSDPAYKQYTAQTSMVSRRIAEVLHDLGVEASPMKIDYIINQYGGFYGNLLTSATAEDAGNVGNLLLEPLESKFIADPLYSSGIVSRFYDVCDEAEASASDAEDKRKENGDSVLTVQERQYKELKKYKDEISNLRKQERQLLASEKDTKERKAKIDAIRAQINDIASKAVLEYEPQS